MLTEIILEVPFPLLLVAILFKDRLNVVLVLCTLLVLHLLEQLVISLSLSVHSTDITLVLIRYDMT